MTRADSESSTWPEIPYPEWRDTCAALHLWCQIVGKYRLAHTPWINHSWHATLYVTPRGLTTGPVPDPKGSTSIDFDFCEHVLVVDSSNGGRERLPLKATSVAQFLDETVELIRRSGGTPDIHGEPNEIPDALPFAQDTEQRPYDADAVARFHQALLQVDRVFSQFRTGFLGKSSPVHLFWGSLDLAVTRFSGQPAPRHPGGIPALPDSVTREAYSHEVSSAGFWAGGGGMDEASFYSYAYPSPAGFSDSQIRPAGARFHETLGEFVMPYSQVQRATNPERELLAFLHSTYEAAANLGSWDRERLECEEGQPRRPRPPFDRD